MFTIRVLIGSVGESDHVQHISNGVVLVDVEFAVVELSVHDHDQIGEHLDLETHRARHDADLAILFFKITLFIYQN